MTSDPILEFDDVSIRYRTERGTVSAVTDASFAIEENEYFGLVGESGCGKSTIAQSIIGVLPANGYVDSGRILYKGQEIQDYSKNRMNDEIRWKEISYIPQNSMNSLNPLARISEQAVEIGRTHTDLKRNEILNRLKELFQVVGLQEDRIYEYPHQFSGGMRQRAIIALALFLEPSVIIADEPTTALDVIMQDQFFSYLDDIRTITDTSILIITHDVGVVFESCDTLAVMHGGQISEIGTPTHLYSEPLHPYSILLQRSFGDIREIEKEFEGIGGNPPQLLNDEVDYCTFADRCPLAAEECREAAPDLESVSATDDHKVACYRTDKSPSLREGEINQPTGEQ